MTIHKKSERIGLVNKKLREKLDLARQRIRNETQKAFLKGAEESVVDTVNFKEFDNMITRQKSTIEEKGGVHLASYISIKEADQNIERHNVLHAVSLESYYQENEATRLLTWRIERTQLHGLPMDIQEELKKNGEIKIEIKE